MLKFLKKVFKIYTFRFIRLFCLYVYIMHMHMYMCAWCLWGAEGGTGSPRTGVADHHVVA